LELHPRRVCTPHTFTMKVPRISLLFLPLTRRNRICNNAVGLGVRSYSVHQRAFEGSNSLAMRPKVTLAHLRKMYMTNQKIAVMTAYDYPSGTFADRAGSDIVLVGDSLGMVALGYQSTNQVTLSVLSLLKRRTLMIGHDSSFEGCASGFKVVLHCYGFTVFVVRVVAAASI